MSVADNGGRSEPYGKGDATFQAAGGEDGIQRLVEAFYRIMAARPEYRRIYEWHPDQGLAEDKLARFLCGWMGGPRRYHEKYGSISIPKVHAHLPVTTTEKGMWLDCMRDALEEQSYPESLKRYLLEQLAYPAEMIRKSSLPQKN